MPAVFSWDAMGFPGSPAPSGVLNSGHSTPSADGAGRASVLCSSRGCVHPTRAAQRPAAVAAARALWEGRSQPHGSTLRGWLFLQPGSSPSGCITYVRPHLVQTSCLESNSGGEACSHRARHHRAPCCTSISPDPALSGPCTCAPFYAKECSCQSHPEPPPS